MLCIISVRFYMRRNHEQASIQHYTPKIGWTTPHAVLGGRFSSASMGEEERDSDSWGLLDFFLLNTAGLSHVFMRNRYVNA